MSLWTPDGERPVGREQRPGSGGPSPTGDVTGDVTGDERAAAEAMAAEMAEVRAQIAEAPASMIVANHVMGFYELAAIHLSSTPPNFEEATVAIDAMAAVLDRLQGRLGEHEETLRDARAQLQLAFVQLKDRADA
jgi:hypothetical protein